MASGNEFLLAVDQRGGRGKAPVLWMLSGCRGGDLTRVLPLKGSLARGSSSTATPVNAQGASLPVSPAGESLVNSGAHPAEEE